MCVIGIMMFCHYVSAFSLYYRSTLSEKEGCQEYEVSYEFIQVCLERV